MRKFNAKPLKSLSLSLGMSTNECIDLKLEDLLARGGSSGFCIVRYTFGTHAWITAFFGVSIVDFD